MIFAVAPFTGAWIEIRLGIYIPPYLVVAPFTGAWIEITTVRPRPRHFMVAPFTGAWIEIAPGALVAAAAQASLPSRERGLKLRCSQAVRCTIAVAPFTGAWIEIAPPTRPRRAVSGRSLHGSVD